MDLADPRTAMIFLIAASVIGLSIAMAAAWLLQRLTGNGGWADAVWTLATGAAGVACALSPVGGRPPGPRAWLVAALAGCWALRLGLHLVIRSAGATREDARYAAIRSQWGRAFEARLFGVLQIQALAAAFLVAAVLVAARNPAPYLRWQDGLGAALLAVAVIGEGVADSQLRRFKAYPPNREAICDVGLWSWSRHPNYFFEWIGWLAYPVIAIDLTGAWPWGWIALAAPVLMFALLRFGSGVPPTEAAMAASRGAAFARYRARVSPFFPLPPKAQPASAASAGGTAR
jgi:steroid 5-alpha reductase family enzyme